MSKLKRKFGKRMKYNYKRTFFALFLFLLLLGVGVGFSYLTTNLSIDGTSNVKSARWDVHFDNLEPNSDNTASGNASYDDTTVNFSTTLNNPGDFYEFTVDVVNAGTLNAKLDSIEILPVLTPEQQNYFNYTVTYSDGLEINEKDALDAGKTEKIKVRVEYKELADASLYPSEDDAIDFSVTMNYEQGNGNIIIRPISFAEDDWDTIVQNVQSGNTSKYNVGDTKEINMGFGTYTLRIANKSTPAECSTTGFSQTACGFVLEFVDIITLHSMNSSSTNLGGWPSSEMRTFVNSYIYNALPTNLKSAIINTTVVSGSSFEDSSNFTSTDKLYLLSIHEVWQDVDGDPNSGLNSYDKAYNNTRQLDYYSSQNITSSNYSGAKKQLSGSGNVWWLRSVEPYNNYTFYAVNNDGLWGRKDAIYAHGVSPAFRLG